MWRQTTAIVMTAITERFHRKGEFTTPILKLSRARHCCYFQLLGNISIGLALYEAAMGRRPRRKFAINMETRSTFALGSEGRCRYNAALSGAYGPTTTPPALLYCGHFFNFTFRVLGVRWSRAAGIVSQPRQSTAHASETRVQQRNSDRSRCERH